MTMQIGLQLPPLVKKFIMVGTIMNTMEKMMKEMLKQFLLTDIIDSILRILQLLGDVKLAK
jgi:hypothetical protein